MLQKSAHKNQHLVCLDWQIRRSLHGGLQGKMYLKAGSNCFNITS